MHSFPAQGATVRGTATLAGHWSQAKQETYVGDTRAIYRHTVHLARDDLGTDGTDEDRIGRYAQRISDNRQRHASIRSTPDPALQLAVRLPDHQPLPSRIAPAAASRHADTPRSKPSTSTADTSSSAAPRAAAGDTSPDPHTAGDARQQQRARLEQHLRCSLDAPPEHLLRALGPCPPERIARERWEREARRLEALRSQSQIPSQPPLSATRVLSPAPASRAPASSSQPSPDRDRRTIGR